MRRTKKRTVRRSLIIVLSVLIFFSGSAAEIEFTVVAQEEPTISDGQAEPYSPFDSGPFYFEALKNGEKKTGVGSSEILAGAFVRQSDDAGVRVGNYKGESDVLIWAAPKGWVEYEVDVAQAGLYEMTAEYYPMTSEDGGGRQSVILSVQINGETPFREAKSVSFERAFQDARPGKYDSDGNQLRSKIEEVEGWKSKPFRDSEGAYSMPLQWQLKQGKNIIRIVSIRQPVALKAISLNPPESIPGYEEVKAQYPISEGNGGEAILIEAEQYSTKNTTSVQAQYDREPLTTPKSYKTIQYNTLGGWDWYKGGQAVSWEFEVPEEGLYKLGMRANQNFRKNLSVYRSISIDGEVPFSELTHYQFPYRSGWQKMILEDGDGHPFLFYLTKGNHTLTMEATFEPYMPIIAAIDHMSNEIRDISQQIRKVTGNREDRYRIWDVEKDIPGIVEQLEALRDQFTDLSEQMLSINGKTDNVLQSFKSSVKDIDNLLDQPNEIPFNQMKIGSLQEKLESKRVDLMNSPLQIDKLYAAPEKGSFPRMVATFFEKIIGMFASLFNSFFVHNQYSKQKEEELNVWMKSGRDYVDELQQLADEQFTAEYGIKVKVNLIQSEDLLVLAKSAGILPDVALGIPQNTPFDMAMRNAAFDLSEFPDADDLLSHYHPGALLPYYYKGGYYGIPETLNFKVLFYRKDIMKQLGLEVPDTWQDVNKMLPTLLQNNMNFYMDPNDFSYHFFQSGVDLYTPDGLSSVLNKPEAFDAFKQWTDYYNIYGLEKQVQSFYNQFRRGTMPIGISDFNQYMHLLVAAPEITNDWGIAPIPGTVQQDGTVARWAAGTSPQTTSIMMFKDTPKEKQDLAWKFVQWYTSEEIQTEYGLNLEQYRGESFRWNSANIEAFVNMPWGVEDLNVILEQWKWIKDLPNVPGGYMTARELNFGWIRSTIDGENPRLSLEKSVKEINRELKRKQREFHIVGDEGKVLIPLDLPQVTEPWGEVDKYVE